MLRQSGSLLPEDNDEVLQFCGVHVLAGPWAPADCPLSKTGGPVPSLGAFTLTGNQQCLAWWPSLSQATAWLRA